jgi:TATA-box binding protein (TBP) (component of TFIID and TFIIIB)
MVLQLLMETTEINVSTMVAIGDIAESLDLDILSEFVRLDHLIRGIKYKDNCQGCIRQTKSFYNQMTLIVFLFNKLINIKLFSNGKVQLTGIKSLIQANEAITYLKHYLSQIDGIFKIRIERLDNLFVSDNVLYGYQDNWKKIGEVNDKHLIISSHEVEKYGDYYRTIAYVDKRRLIFDYAGVCIGYTEIVFNKKRKNMVLKNITYSDGKVYNKWGNEIGIENVHIQPRDMAFKPTTGYIIVPYSVIHEPRRSNHIEIVNINCNYKMKTEQLIDRTKLTEFFIEQGFLVDYDPCGYPGVKIFVFVENNSLVSRCSHVDRSKSKKCNCIKISVIFFQSGTILLSGCRNMEQTKDVQKLIFRVLLDKEINRFLFTPFNNIPKMTESLEEISIEDLL